MTATDPRFAPQDLSWLDEADHDDPEAIEAARAEMTQLVADFISINREFAGARIWPWLQRLKLEERARALDSLAEGYDDFAAGYRAVAAEVRNH